jgi:hypothetical protein
MAFAFVFGATGAFAVQASLPEPDSLRFEVLLTGKILDSLHIHEDLVSSIEITSNQLILLATSQQFYLLGWGGIVPVGEKQIKPIDSFSYTFDGNLFVISTNQVCYVDSVGNLSTLFIMSSTEMGISTGTNLMYVHERNPEKNTIYAFSDDGNVERWVTAPRPIMSVLEHDNILLFSSGNCIFSFNPQNKELDALLRIDEDDEILSMSKDEFSNSIYFSTRNAIYRIEKSKFGKIIDSFGGIIKCYDRSLLVFNTDKKNIIRICWDKKE